MVQKLLSIHNRILNQRLNELETDVRKRTPEIQKKVMIREFMKAVNTFTFKERLVLVWRILIRKL